MFFRQLSCILLAFSICSIDLWIQARTLEKASIAIQSFNQYISFSGINVASSILFVLFSCTLVAQLFFNSRQIVFLVLGLLLFELPRQAILYVFITCFNYSSNWIVYTRLLLTILFFISVIANHLDYIEEEDEANWNPSIIFSILALLIILTLNVIIFFKLKSPQSSFSTKNIQIGFFNTKEIEDMENGVFIRDLNFESRIIGNLDEVIFSKEKEAVNGTYVKIYLSKIYCAQDKVDIYSNDCKNSEYLRIFLIYSDQADYPKYNCGILGNNTCRIGCPSLLYEFKLILVQVNQQRVQTAWHEFCNCYKNPKIYLTQDLSIDSCQLSKAYFTKSSNLLIYINFVIVLGLLQKS